MRNTVKDTWLLTSAALKNIYNVNKFFKKGSDGNSAAPTVYLISLLIIIPVSFLFYSGLCDTLKEISSLNLIIYLAVMAISASTFFTCLFKASSFLFTFKDLDMLKSFPVTPRAILASKLMSLYISTLFLSAVLGLPGLILYGFHAGKGVLYYVYAIVVFLLLPVIPMIIGSALSFIPMGFVSRFKKNGLLTLISKYIYVFIIIFLNFFLRNITSGITENVDGISAAMGYYPPGDIFAGALVGSDFPQFLLSVAINFVFIIAFLFLLSKKFNKINASLNENYSRSNYKMKPLTASTPLIALYKKELRTYFSSYIYVINTSFGMILMTVYSVALLFFDFETIAAVMDMPTAGGLILPFTSAVFIFCISLSCTTAASFSIEGRSISVLKSLPVSFSEIVRAKILMNFTVSLPLTLLNSFILLFVSGFNISGWSLLLSCSMAYAVLTAFIGIIANLYFPKMEWKSQVQAVKQSTSVFVSMVAAMVCAIVPIVICADLMERGAVSFNNFVYITIAVVTAACCGLWAFIRTKGAKLYKQNI